jgi:hypothetical protein
VIADGPAYLSGLSGVRTFADWLARLPAPLARAADRVGALRGVLLFVASVRHETVAVIRTGPGWRSLLLLRALLGRRRKLVVLHFLVHPEPEGGLPRALYRLWDPIDRLAIRRATREGQVLTAWEREDYAERYRLSQDRFRLVPWPWRRTAGDSLPEPPREPLVLSSGRALCDWPTLFAAARGSEWPLVVVCSADDLPEVRALNADAGADVRSEIPPHEHAALMARATVLVVTMREREVSQGQVRLMDAADAGVPVVITGTRGLQGYVEPGRTAILVPPEDPAALRTAVDGLLADAPERERIRRAAWERSLAWTGEHYLRAIGDLLRGEVSTVDVPVTADDPSDVGFSPWPRNPRG